MSQFQSAPLTEARGDDIDDADRVVHVMFQSAPLTEARGDPTGLPAPVPPVTFQSAPLTEARGDMGCALLGIWSASFNPRL